MAGLALYIDRQGPPQDLVFKNFLKSVAACKSLEAPALWGMGASCIAAKLDAQCSLHKGIAQDRNTGSWLLAAGTVIDQSGDSPDGRLDRILVDYLEQGERIFSRLDGQFALILYDARAEKVLVLSDPFGLIPVYYGQKGGRIFLSTSALAVAKMVRSPLSEFAARSFLMYYSTFGDTLWQDVHVLSPASVLTIDRDGLHQSAYWSFQLDSTIAALPQDEAVDCMIESLSGSLRRSLGREGKVWISLTGGMDSRMLAALADYSRIPFKTYCHGPVDSRDVRIAAQISKKMGWEHEYFALPDDWGAQRVNWFEGVVGQTDGLLDIIKMSRTIREQTIKAQQLGVSLWGYGGELHRGVYWKHEFWRTGASTEVDYERLMDYRVIPSSSLILKDTDHWKRAMRAEIKSRLQIIGEQQPDWLNTVKLNMIGTALERHTCGTTIAAVLGQQRVILPFDFKENITRIFSINYRFCTHGRMFRLTLERINPRLANIETADGGPALSMRFSNFHRFIPYWLDTMDKLTWRLGYKILGRPLWQQRNAGPSGGGYPTGQWLEDTSNELNQQALLDPDHMLSGDLFDQRQFKDLVSNPGTASLARESMLGRILALEMAQRFVCKGQ